MMSTDFVASYIDAWNQHDPKGVAEHLAQGGTYCDIPEQRRLSSDALVAYLADFFSHDSNRYKLVGEVLAGENTIAFQYLASPAGRDEEGWMGAEFITMDGDGARLIEDYYRDPGLTSRGRGATESGRRYAKSGLDPAGLNAVLARLLDAMERDQIFLDSHLSLPDLAARLGCSINHLSQAINEGHGVSFFDFINRYRVQRATQLLGQPTGSGSDCTLPPSILDVALAVGFNSTSTFYAAFKKATGQTPAQFRRRASGDD